MTEGPVYFLVHVPKCAGTTVEQHFEAHLGRRFLIAPRWESPLRNVLGNRYDYRPGDRRLDGVQVVSGHSLSASLKPAFGDREVRECVLLRDPVGFHLSLYNYRWDWHRKGHGPKPSAFPAWYRVQRRNPVSRFLLNRYAGEGVPALYRFSSIGRLRALEGLLERFWFVGDYRRAGEMIAGISRDLGLPERVKDRNVTQERVATAEGLGQAWLARISRDNAIDATLHARWRNRGWLGDTAEGRGAVGASNPADPARRPDGAGTARGAAFPVLPALDQWRHVLGDIASGLGKKLLR